MQLEQRVVRLISDIGDLLLIFANEECGFPILLKKQESAENTKNDEYAEVIHVFPIGVSLGER